MDRFDEAEKIMAERFGKDSVIALATIKDGVPQVRNVDAFYEDGCFWVVTWGLSNKMKEIAASPTVAVCGEWFQGHGTGESLGHVLLPRHEALMARLRVIFSAWYDHHANEKDPNTSLLRIRMTRGVLMKEGTRYEMDYGKRQA